ncbi:hypothetical protein JHK86_006759 [Glycine max]|nr:hypothetical protein JHK86_006759 [Glycine max]
MMTQNHLKNLYCVYGNGDLGDLDDGNYGGVAVSGEMMLPYDQVVMSNATAQSVSVMKQEMCSGREQSERRVLGGFPWQINADTNIIGELDSGKPIASWNSFTNSCHGILQRTLM